MINLIIGLISAMLANILLGTTLAKLKEEFKKKKFYDGIFKAITIAIAVILMLVCGNYNKDLIINLQGIKLSINEAIILLFKTTLIAYITKDIKAIIDLFGIKISKEENIINIERSEN